MPIRMRELSALRISGFLLNYRSSRLEKLMDQREILGGLMSLKDTWTVPRRLFVP
jgi:hypothetical protein